MLMKEFAVSMTGWFTMVMVMGYFIWQEFKNNELELEEDEEPPSICLALKLARI